jgi:hypothetical protein
MAPSFEVDGHRTMRDTIATKNRRDGVAFLIQKQIK